jgi:nucleotide-binding universal stress UspA family protein
MLPVKVIFCPIDFSDPCYKGLEAACELASHFKADLRLINVVPVLPGLPNDPNYVLKVPEYELQLHKDAESRLQQVMQERIPKELRASFVIGHGDAAEEIVRVSDEEKVDLIVIATHGESGWHRLWFGSVAERVVRSALRPVLTIRDQAA